MASLDDVTTFAGVILVVSATGLLAVLSNRLSARIKVPAPLFFLIAAAVAARVVPSLHTIPHQTVERLVTVALVLILFDGGLGIGWRRLRPALGPVVTVGVIGTFLTAGAVALLAHAAFGFGWWVALLVGTAVSPTDPAVVFAVLAGREIAGRSGTILEGESGANDPVGIALMTGLLTAGGVGAGALVDVGGLFALQMVVGTAVGALAGLGLRWALAHVRLPSEGLYPLAMLFAVGSTYGLAAVAHGSGYLAVFVAGILLGDVRAPFKREIERFHGALAGLGEIVAFVVLGLTVDLRELAHPNVWGAGLIIGAVLILVVRPVLVGLCLLPVALQRRERAFILWAGLKGAVPILLGALLLDADVPDAPRLYGIVIMVVVLSVLGQGSTVPGLATALGLPLETVEPAPWALGVRLRDEPEGVHYLTVAEGSAAAGRTVAELHRNTRFGPDGDTRSGPDGGTRSGPDGDTRSGPDGDTRSGLNGDTRSGPDGEVWISVIVRDDVLVAVRSRTRLEVGDRLMVLAEPGMRAALRATFG